MAYSISASIKGRYEISHFERLADAAAEADRWRRELATTPVRFKRDGVLIEIPDEFDRLLKAETSRER